MRVIRHDKHAVNISRTERIVSAAVGGFLVATGVRKRSPAGIAMAIAGGDLLRRGVSGHCYLMEALGVRSAPRGQGREISVPYELGVRIDRSVTVNRPREEVYAFWRNLSNLPRFMKNLASVQVQDGNRSHWVVNGPAGRTVGWDAEIHNEVTNERIAWRSLPGADVDNAGAVIFKDAPAGRGTEIKVELQYNPPAGMVGAAFAALFGKDPESQVAEDLHRLKQILEAGEISTTEGQPSGRAEKHHKPARRKVEREVESTSEASFPASDAPAYHL